MCCPICLLVCERVCNCVRNAQRLSEFLDVTVGEKLFFKLWNAFIFSHMYALFFLVSAKKLIALCCRIVNKVATIRLVFEFVQTRARVLYRYRLWQEVSRHLMHMVDYQLIDRAHALAMLSWLEKRFARFARLGVAIASAEMRRLAALQSGRV